MKKSLILIAAFIFAAKIATAQTEKGTQTLGLNLSVSSDNLNGTSLNYNDNTLSPTSSKTNMFNIGPTYSYFIANKLDIGAELSFSHFSMNETPNYSPEKQVQNNFGVDIFLRKYFMCSDKFGFRAGPYAGYGRMHDTYTYATPYSGALTNSLNQSIYGGVKLDLVYYPAKYLGVSATLANAEYTHAKQNNGDLGSNTSNAYGLALITQGVDVSVFYTF